MKYLACLRTILIMSLTLSAAVMSADNLSALRECRVDITSVNRAAKLEFVSAGIGCEVSHPVWGPEAQRKATLVCQASGLYNQWIEASVSFRSPAGGEVAINVKGPYVMQGGKKKAVYVHYDDFRASGFELINPSFERKKGKCPLAWESTRSPRNPLLLAKGAKQGKQVLSVWHDEGVNQVVTLPAGKTVTLKFAFKVTVLPGGGADTLLVNEVTDGRIIIRQGKEWKSIDMSDLAVKPGSALDCSHFVDDHKVGEKGRVVIRNGRLEFENEPGKPIRFWGCSMGSVELGVMKERSEVKAYVEQVRRQGYNMIRPHFLDGYLMGNAKKALEFDPHALKMFQYMVKCMKDNGIYMYFDAATSWGLYQPGNTWTKHRGKTHYKALLYTNEEARQHYYAGVKKLLTHINPYTGQSLINDPVIVALLYYNEQEIYLNQDFVPPEYLGPWRKRLKERYGNIATLRKKWTTPEARKYLSGAQSIDKLPLFKNRYGLGSEGGAFSDDLGLFLHQQDLQMARWYDGALKKMGYKGPTTQWDCQKQLRFQAARNSFPVISMHGYHNHPHTVNGRTKVRQNSSLSDQAGYYRGIASTRYLDRPFMLMEYLHTYWNRTRYEEALVMGALASMQDFDCLMAHAHPVFKTRDRVVSGFRIALDPVARANQVLTGYLYAAGYAKPSRNSVLVEMDHKDIFQSGVAMQGMNSDQTKISLLTGFGISMPKKAPAFITRQPKPVLRIRPQGWSKVGTHTGGSRLEGGDSGSFNLEKTVAQLRQKGVLGKNNKTDVSEGIFHSDTGEILMDSEKLEMRVQTPRLEGVTVAVKGRKVLKHLYVESSTSYGTVAVLSLDKMVLSKSRRLLFIYNTDALTEGDEFSLDRSVQLVKAGQRDIHKAPVMKVGKLKAALAHDSGSLKLYALALNGERREEIPMTYDGGKLQINIDTAKLKHGPTPFFELVAE